VKGEPVYPFDSAAEAAGKAALEAYCKKHGWKFGVL
jgi:hypothetical protein